MNKVELVGRLVADPELNENASESDVSRCNFTLAVRKEFKVKEGESDSYFIRCVAWRQTADYLYQYGAKGRLIGLVGSLQPRMYEKDGVKHYPTDVVADRIEFLSSAGNANQETGTTTQATAPSGDDSELPF